MQRIMSRIAEPIDIDGQELMVTLQRRHHLYPQDGPDVETLLKNADAAMYQAKEKGRNNFQFYTAEMNRQVSERLKTETSLRRALERDEFALYYQPRFDVGSGAWWAARPCFAGSIRRGGSCCRALYRARRGDRAYLADRRVGAEERVASRRGRGRKRDPRRSRYR